MLSRYIPKKIRIIGSWVIIVFGCFVFLTNTFVVTTVTGCVVKDKSNLGYTDKSNRVYAEGCNGSSEGKTFAVRSQWFAGQFNAGDTYATIEEGKTYNFTTRGLDIPFASVRGNIVDAKEVSK